VRSGFRLDGAYPFSDFRRLIDRNANRGICEAVRMETAVLAFKSVNHAGLSAEQGMPKRSPDNRGEGTVSLQDQNPIAHR
jgi:hypothetical protein